MMLRRTLFLCFWLATAWAGTMCPQRDLIYPCSCANVIQGKKLTYTLVACHRIHDTNQMDSIFSYLRMMQIDQLYLYDSFWAPHMLGDAGRPMQVLSADWFSLKAKEIEIVDTPLAPDFACKWKLGCTGRRNSMTTRFTAINSSATDKLVTLCDTGLGNKFPWTGCMSGLRHFHMSRSPLAKVGKDLFAWPMPELTLLNLTRNQISSVEKEAFNNLPKLTHLDLSHNSIESLGGWFVATKVNTLEFLDVSWNSIKEIGITLIPALPKMKVFLANSNVIVHLKEDDWKHASQTLRLINLDENPLHCDCNIRWLNSTFHVSTQLSGTCATPPDYENSAVRKSSRFLVERCDEAGNIGTRPSKTTKAYR